MKSVSFLWQSLIIYIPDAKNLLIAMYTRFVLTEISGCSIIIAYVFPIDISWPVTYFSLHSHIYIQHVILQTEISDWSRDICWENICNIYWTVTYFSHNTNRSNFVVWEVIFFYDSLLSYTYHMLRLMNH